MLDAGLRAELIELLSHSFNSDEISEIGKLVLRKFDLHRLTNRHRHVTVPVREAAQTLVEQCEEKKNLSDLLQIVIESDGSKLMGRRVEVKDLELFLAGLARAGHVYDFSKRKLRQNGHDSEELVNWGALREGREYEVTVASVDIVGNSELVRSVGQKTMERVYYQFWAFLRERLAHYDGRIWSWAGDGGVLAFAMKGNAVRGVQCGLEIQATIPIFNARPENPIEEPISVRIGMDQGRVKFQADTGRIISETINFAAHVEKAGTDPGKVTISASLAKQLPAGLKSVFIEAGTFEGRQVFTTAQRPDGWTECGEPQAPVVQVASSGSASRDHVPQQLE